MFVVCLALGVTLSVCVQVFLLFWAAHPDEPRRHNEDWRDEDDRVSVFLHFLILLYPFFLRFHFSRFLWRCLTLLVLCLGLLRFVRLVEAVVKKVLPTKDKVLSLYVLLPKVENRQRRSSPFSQKAMHVLLQLSPHCMSSTFTKLQYCCCEVEEVYSLNGSK